MIIREYINGGYKIKVTQIIPQKEEIIESRPLKDGEDFYTFHKGNGEERKIETKPLNRNNPNKRFSNNMNESIKNVNIGDNISFGLNIKKSY